MTSTLTYQSLPGPDHWATYPYKGLNTDLQPIAEPEHGPTTHTRTWTQTYNPYQNLNTGLQPLPGPEHRPTTPTRTWTRAYNSYQGLNTGLQPLPEPEHGPTTPTRTWTRAYNPYQYLNTDLPFPFRSSSRSQYTKPNAIRTWTKTKNWGNLIWTWTNEPYLLLLGPGPKYI